MLRLFLYLILFYALYRFLKMLARGLSGSSRPRSEVHHRPPPADNPVRGGRIVDVKFTERPEDTKESHKTR